VNSDLEYLIRLQQLETDIDSARRRIAEIPLVQQALEARLAEQTAAVDAVKERLAANQAGRRDVEKEVATQQSRLSKYKDQLMEVKTNKEYQAMQHEIATAGESVRSQEDRVLDFMEEAETLGRELKDAEAALKKTQGEIASERTSLDGEAAELQQRVLEMSAGRSDVARHLSAAALGLFEHVARQRKGLAIAEARDGHCTVCHVRLRPQVFNEVRRNDSLIQCDSCLRILYFAGGRPAGEGAAQNTATQAS
jgi:predicted  nucleic acid-binding Zn-ribbon protein